MSLLEINDLKVTFKTGDGDVNAVNGLSLNIDAGQTLAIVGESGSGKSQTAFATMGLLARNGAATGSVKFDGKEPIGLSTSELNRVRSQEIGMIFQDPMMTLNPVLRIDTQMIEAITAHENVDHQTAWERSRDALGLVGIPSPEERLRAYPHQLSGGMRQRVAIATAFLNKPDLIIADEPTTALDVTIQAQIIHEAQNLTRRTGRIRQEIQRL